MKISMFAAALFTMVIALAGCRSAATFDGRPCYGLSESELNTLVENSRDVLVNRSAFMKPEDKSLVQSTQPEIKVKYTDDRTGSIRVIWDLPKRTVAIVYTGRLMTEEMTWMAEKFEKGDEIVFTEEVQKIRKLSQPENGAPAAGEPTPILKQTIVTPAKPAGRAKTPAAK